jgi:hypothetical protein
VAAHDGSVGDWRSSVIGGGTVSVRCADAALAVMANEAAIAAPMVAARSGLQAGMCIDLYYANSRS